MDRNDMSALLPCLIPIVLGIGAIQLAHEFMHYFVAITHDLRVGVPVAVPSVRLGTLGCISPLKSFPSDRQAMFDFSLSGPALAFVLSLASVVLGTLFTARASPSSIATFPVIPMAHFQSSFLVGSIVSRLAPKLLLLPLSQPVPVHPLCIIGFVGLITSALNLLPLTCLDGGRACNMVCGTRIAALWSASTLLFTLSLVLSGESAGLALSFLFFVVFFQRRPDLPVRDDVTEVSDVRKCFWVVSLLAAALTLTPFSPKAGFL
jgi:membrane-associated protease RseP (regulator of RpoE activity)